jgi:protein phosphatase 1L
MDVTVAVSEDIGQRHQMEDEHASYRVDALNFLSIEVYDGHNGRSAAQLAAEMLTPHLLDAWREELEKPARKRRRLETLVKEAYLAADQYILKRGIVSGTAAATLYLMDHSFIAANAGDSRVVMGTQDGSLALTMDHKPDIESERRRIESLGGKVIFVGVPRVLGMLAMSRALGDPELKPFVTPVPRVIRGLLGRENDFAIVACDGIWDVLSGDRALELVRDAGDAHRGAERVKRTARAAGSTDNITVMVADLRKETAKLAEEQMRVISTIDYG